MFTSAFQHDYNNARAVSRDVYHNESFALPTNIKPYEAAGNNNLTGFMGQAYMDASTDTIYIGFRGTVNPQDYFNDYQIGVGQMPEQFADALAFVQLRKADARKQFGVNIKVVLTGHSLGGSLAQLVSAVTGDEAITYNTLGVGRIAAKNNLSASAGNQIYNFRIGADPITWPSHDLFGAVYYAPSYLPAPSRSNDRKTFFRGALLLEYSEGSLDVPNPDIFHQIDYFFRSDVSLSAFAQYPGHFYVPSSILKQPTLNPGAANILGTAGNDTLHGGGGADIINGNTGNDLIIAGSGNNDLYGAGGNDTLQGGSGGDVYMSGWDGNDVIQGKLANNAFMRGGSGNDTLIGGTGNSFFIGETGNDSMQGGSGNNIFLFNKGDGNDSIGDRNGSAKSGTEGVLDFITLPLDDLTFTRTGKADLLLRSQVSQDSLLIRDQFLEKTPDPNTHVYTNGVDQIEFADDTFITRAILNDIFVDNPYLNLSASALAGLHVILGKNNQDNQLFGSNNPDTLIGGNQTNRLDGQGGNDSLYGAGTHDTLIGGAGNDFIVGGPGVSVFLFAANLAANGVDTISNPSGNGAPAGIATLDFSQWSGVDGRLQIDLSSATNQIASVLHNGVTVPLALTPFAGGGAGFQNVMGSHGSDALTGNTGNNLLTGNGGNDTFTGGSGNDSLLGGSGNDTYRFLSASGIDTLQDSGGMDTLRFESGTDPNAIAFFKQGLDLEIAAASNLSAEITVKNFYGAGSIEHVQRPDGSYLSGSQVNGVIQAMAAYAQSHGQSFHSLADVEKNPNLMAIIHAAWHH